MGKEINQLQDLENAKIRIMDRFLTNIRFKEMDREKNGKEYYEKMYNIIISLKIKCEEIMPIVMGQIKKDGYKGIENQLTGQIRQLERIQELVEDYGKAGDNMTKEGVSTTKDAIVSNIKIAIEKFNKFCEMAKLRKAA